ncbi:kinase-like domain-containing protein [Pilobolus umbonatus]|nr:kinase-like domain-containing protein [Pilobolus umbonatus]
MHHTPSHPTLSTEVDNPSHPLHPLRRDVGDFDYGDIIGEGSYSTVIMGRDKKTGKQYAIKRLDKAHIVKNNKVKYVMIERDALNFVLDLARNGELYTYIRRLAPFDLETTRFYAAELLLAIEHIHNRGVIHSILLDDDMHIKVTDFGSAKIINESEVSEPTQSRSFVGTAEYVSPELLKSEPVSKEADLWALGCVIFQMLTGKSPFKAATDYLIFQKIKNLEYTMPTDLPDLGKDIIQKLLLKDPESRLGSESTGGLTALKNHPFFHGIDWDHLFESSAPPLRERLEEEMKKNKPNEEEDMWFGSVEEKRNPFSDLIRPSLEETNMTYRNIYHDTTKRSAERLAEQSHPPW